MPRQRQRNWRQRAPRRNCWNDNMLAQLTHTLTHTHSHTHIRPPRLNQNQSREIANWILDWDCGIWSRFRITHCKPRCCPKHSFRESLCLGVTSLTKQEPWKKKWVEATGLRDHDPESWSVVPAGYGWTILDIKSRIDVLMGSHPALTFPRRWMSFCMRWRQIGQYRHKRKSGRGNGKLSRAVCCYRTSHNLGVAQNYGPPKLDGLFIIGLVHCLDMNKHRVLFVHHFWAMEDLLTYRSTRSHELFNPAGQATGAPATISYLATFANLTIPFWKFLTLFLGLVGSKIVIGSPNRSKCNWKFRPMRPWAPTALPFVARCANVPGICNEGGLVMTPGCRLHPLTYVEIHEKSSVWSISHVFKWL